MALHFLPWLSILCDIFVSLLFAILVPEWLIDIFLSVSYLNGTLRLSFFLHSFIHTNCPYRLTVFFITVASKIFYPLNSPFCLSYSLTPSFLVVVCFIHLKNLICIAFYLLICLAWSVSVFLLWHIILFVGIFITEKHVLTCSLPAAPLLAALPAQPFFTLCAHFAT
jgi:hypothetical protein